MIKTTDDKINAAIDALIDLVAEITILIQKLNRAKEEVQS